MLWHEHLRRTAKLAVVGGLHYTGLLGLVRRAVMKERALILMYHRVSPRGQGVPDYSPNGMTVTPREFAMHMRFLRQHYDVVPLSRIVQAVRGQATFASNMCAVTFDDGWRDVYQYAFPVLREHRIPATIYLTSGFIDDDEWFWEERSKYLLALLYQHRRSGSWNLEPLQSARCQLDEHGFGDLLQLRDARMPGYLLEKGRDMKRWAPGRRRRFVQALEEMKTCLVPAGDRPFMNWVEVREMAAQGIEFENHTRSHPILPELAPKDVVSELHAAAECIEKQLGRSPRHVAYPYGKYDDDVRSEFERQNVYSASTTRYGLVEPGADPLALNRVNMCSDVAGLQPLFAARILCL